MNATESADEYVKQHADEPALRVGFCGLGKMGLPMARRLAEAGFRTALWNRSAQKAHALGASLSAQASAANDAADVAANVAANRAANPSASAFETPAEVAAYSEAVMLCLADYAAVEAVAFGSRGLARGAPRDLIVVDHSTMAPAQAQALARRWRDETGGAWIDAPVSGGTAGAAAGTLAIMAGGDANAIDALLGAMRAYAARVTRLGASGAGQAAKLANQTIVMTTIAGIAEATRLARRTGIEAARLPAALAGGWADSVLLQTLQPRMIAAPAQPSGTIRTMLKDLDAVESFARENGTFLPVAALVRRWLARACEQGLADADISQIVTVELDQA